MESTIGKSHASGITSDLESSNSEREEHISKQTRLISTILSKESEEGFFLKLKKSDDKNQASSNIQMDIVNDPSIRCILSFGMRKYAACQECLALHSEWLSIRTYHLSFRPKIPLAELSVFRSKYKSENIVKKCREKFCLAFLPWSLADCQKFSAVFYHSSLLLKKKLSNYPSDDNQIHVPMTEKGLEPDKISKILKQADAKRMSRFSEAKSLLRDASKMKPEGRIMAWNDPKCLMVTSHYNEIHDCLSCVLKYTRDGPRVILTISITFATIFTDTPPVHDCQRCQSLRELDPDKCLEYLDESSTLDTESYQHLLKSPYTDPSIGTCMVLYHTPSRKDRCISCVTKLFGVRELKLSTAFASFLDASETNPEITLRLFGESTSCHKKNSCRKIQQVPNRFCSEHRAYSDMTHGGKEKRKRNLSTIHELTKHRMYVGVWPPSSQQTVKPVETALSNPSYWTPVASDSGTNIWPICSQIAFVEFTCSVSKQLDCASCLIQHSEINFVYYDKNWSSGYVWMRQARAHVFRQCLDTYCSSLAYDDRISQMERHIGLRQWTIEDIRERNNEN